VKLKRVLYLAVSAVIAVSASLFAGNTVKAMKSEIKKETQKQLVLTQGSDLSSDNLLLAHSSHRSHSSHSSHSSHRSHYSSK
jgi:hypothetical protein